MLNTLINYEFSNYLNRYLKGISKLSNRVKKISLQYELSDAFSNESCRFLIDVEFHNFGELSESEKQLANKFFHNSSSSSGSKFVSFVYKSQRNYTADLEVIKDFIFHYQFAESIFEDFVKNLITEKTDIEIMSLEDEPLFNYSLNFFNHIKYSENNTYDERNYNSIMNRRFDFDLRYHGILEKASEKFSEIESGISDNEIFKNNGGSIEDIRRFVIEKGIPFSKASYSNTVTEISVDINELKKKLKDYVPSSFEKIDKKIILKMINDKEKASEESKLLLEKLTKDSGLQLGDYIIVEKDSWGHICNDIGIIKEFNVNYKNELEISYNSLKTDMQESKMPNKSTKIKNVSYTVNANKTAELNLSKPIMKKTEVIQLLKKSGIKNKKYQK